MRFVPSKKKGGGISPFFFGTITPSICVPSARRGILVCLLWRRPDGFLPLCCNIPISHLPFPIHKALVIPLTGLTTLVTGRLPPALSQHFLLPPSSFFLSPVACGPLTVDASSAYRARPLCAKRYTLYANTTIDTIYYICYKKYSDILWYKYMSPKTR